MVEIRKRILEITKEIQEYSPYPERVKIIAVSKYLTAEDMIPYLEAGIIVLGENKAQAIQEKMEKLEPYSFSKNLEWHFIGNLQKNKVRHIVDRVKMIHSINKLSLAQEIDKRAEYAGIIMPVLIEINVAEEESKEGYPLEEVEKDIPTLLQLKHISIQGLMTMAPFTEDLKKQREVFATLRHLQEEWNEKYFQGSLQELSMGMTNDYTVALQEGATMIRLGRKIFY